MRKILTITLILFTLSPIGAVDWSVTALTGFERNTTSGLPFVGVVGASIGGFDALLQYQAEGDANLTLGYTFRQGETIEHRVDAYTEYVPKEGGWTGLAYTFSQHFTWDWFTLRYWLSFGANVSYSEYSDILVWGICPDIGLATTFTFGAFEGTIYATMNHPLDRAWRYRPYVGATLSYDLMENLSLVADGYVGWSEIITNRIPVLNTWAVRVGIRYQGN